MELREIARELQGTAANLALRMPISWVNILSGPSVTVDGVRPLAMYPGNVAIRVFPDDGRGALTANIGAARTA